MRVLPVLRAESIKLEPQTRINVDFKPNKKMRKRRELDALVNNGKSRRIISTSVTKKGQHELLRSVDEDEESESSEEIEFTLAAQNKSVIRKKRTSCWPGSGYIPMCAFILVVLCLLVCGGLIWFLYELRREVELIRSEISTVESTNQGLPDEFQSLHTIMKDIENKVEGGKGLDYLNSQIKSILQQLTYLNKTTGQLSKGQATAQDLADVPKAVELIKRNVADLGSAMKSIHNEIAELKSFRTRIQQEHDALKSDVTSIQAQLSSTTTPAPRSSDASESPKTSSVDLSRISDAVNSLNSTLISVKERVDSVETKMSDAPTSPEWSDQSNVQALVDTAMKGYMSSHEANITLFDHRLNLVNASLETALEQINDQSAALRNVTRSLRNLEEQQTAAATVFQSPSATTASPSNGADVKPPAEESGSPAEPVVTVEPVVTTDVAWTSTQSAKSDPDLSIKEGGAEERPLRRKRGAYRKLRSLV